MMLLSDLHNPRSTLPLPRLRAIEEATCFEDDQEGPEAIKLRGFRCLLVATSLL